MKKFILPLTGMILVSIAFTACSNNATSKAAGDSSVITTGSGDTGTMKHTAVVYTCKMHPEVIIDKPGKCPKCGMDLVKKEDAKKDSTMPGMKMDSAK